MNEQESVVYSAYVGKRTLRGGLFHADREACAYSGGAVEVIACLEKADEVDFGKILPHLNERDTSKDALKRILQALSI